MSALPLGDVVFDLGSEGLAAPSEVTPEHPLEFPLGKVMTVLWNGAALEIGKHTLTIDFEANPFGRLSFKVKDSIREHKEERITVPYDKEDNYSDEIIRARREFLTSFSGAKPEHLFTSVLRPEADRRQYRELHRCRPDPHRPCRPGHGQRRVRQGRFRHPHGHHRRDPGRVVQPRHEGAQPLGRRHRHGFGRPDAARAGLHLRLAPGRRGTSAAG